jgi:hypothetical protein
VRGAARGEPRQNRIAEITTSYLTVSSFRHIGFTSIAALALSIIAVLLITSAVGEGPAHVQRLKAHSR